MTLSLSRSDIYREEDEVFFYDEHGVRPAVILNYYHSLGTYRILLDDRSIKFVTFNDIIPRFPGQTAPAANPKRKKR